MAGATDSEQRALWTPSPQQRDSAELWQFMQWAGERHGIRFEAYSDCWRWSVDSLDDFWADIWEFCGVRASAPYEQVLATREMPGTRWFTRAQLNYAENLLLGRAGGER